MADAPPVEAAAPAKGADVEESLEALRKKVVDSGGPKGVSKQVALERLTLAYFLVRMQIEQADARGRLDATELDEAELLAEQEEGEADSEPGAPAVVVVSEGSGSESDDHLDDHVPGGAAAGAAAH
jgi:hypothetical protein